VVLIVLPATLPRSRVRLHHGVAPAYAGNPQIRQPPSRHRLDICFAVVPQLTSDERMEPSVGGLHCWPREVAYDCGATRLAWSIRRPELGVPDGARYVTRTVAGMCLLSLRTEERTVTRLDEGGPASWTVASQFAS